MKCLVTVAWTILMIALIACSPSGPDTVKNELGHYSITVLPGWTYKIDGSSLYISSVKPNSVKAVLNITSLQSDYNTLEESVYNYTYDLATYFTDARKIGDGHSEIKGLPTMWYRMKAKHGEVKEEVLLYMVQLDNRQLITMNCAAGENAFIEFEEEFIKMIFSFSPLNRTPANDVHTK